MIQRLSAASYPFILSACVAMLSLFAVQQVSARNLPEFTDLAKQNSPSVVNISTSQKPAKNPLSQQMPELPEGVPDIFRHFFGEGGMPESNQQVSSLGSGFIISQDGYVITNHHVVAEADEIIVRLNDRSEYNAQLIGSDKQTDIAVLKIDAKGLPAAKIGQSNKVEVGEWVLAIGSPFGFDYSVTAGIVSAIGRNLPNENYIPFIQTDVAINPGNSGGPLFNLDGEAIGVNSQIYSRTGGFMGLSFAIPMDIVLNVYEQIRDTGSVSRGWLGVMIQDVTRDLAESFGMKKPGGALVAKVLDGSPAAAAGVEAGDIITVFNGHEIETSSDLPPVVGTTKVGTSAPVEVLRNGKAKTLTVKIAAMPDQEVASTPSESHTHPHSPEPETRLKARFRDLTADQRQQLDIKAGQGVLVEEVSEGPAASAGILPGDVVLMLDNEKITSSKQITQLIDALPAKRSVPVLINREGNPLFLAIKLP